MQSVILALALSASATACKFEDWKVEHGVNFETPEEHRYRQRIFELNSVIVEEHNENFKHGRESFELGLNKFAAMTNEEFGAMYRRPRATRAADSAEAVFAGNATTTPDSYDWREIKNVVTPIKDQGQCGSCWAFSAVAAMEGAYNYKSGSLNAFSEQELVDCVNNGRYTCNLGGEMSDGIKYIATDKSGKINTETQYPYTGTSSVRNNCQADDSDAVSTGITGFTQIPAGDEDALKAASAAQTVISVGIDASSTQFQLYKSGVYAPSTCSSSQLDHGVAVVGYGTESGGDYWIVKNSWGTSWGIDGYINMARNDNNKCGIATDAVYANI